MKICHLSYYDMTGGAARAAHRIHRSLRDAGMDSMMLVQDKSSNEDEIRGYDCRPNQIWNKVQRHLDGLIQAHFDQFDVMASSALLPGWASFAIRSQAPTILNLHWIAQWMISAKQIARIDVPVVWTAHDLWPILGGLHYYGLGADQKTLAQAQSFEDEVAGTRYARWCRKRFARAWKDKGIHLVAPSKWLAGEAERHMPGVFASVSVIPYPLDLEIYAPQSRADARRRLGLPIDKPIVLSGSDGFDHDMRKGGDLLERALTELGGRRDVTLVTFGGKKGEEARLCNGITLRHLGVIRDESTLADAYRAADVFVAASREDNLPNTVLEASACGVPTVAFDIGGMPDMIHHRDTGYLAEPFSTEDLANGIAWALENPKAGAAARKLAERNNAPHTIAEAYAALYERVLNW